MPKLLYHTQNEMYRYNCDDIIVTMEAYTALWESKALKKRQLSIVHTLSDAFLHDTK